MGTGKGRSSGSSIASSPSHQPPAYSPPRKGGHAHAVKTKGEEDKEEDKEEVLPSPVRRGGATAGVQGARTTVVREYHGNPRKRRKPLQPTGKTAHRYARRRPLHGRHRSPDRYQRTERDPQACCRRHHHPRHPRRADDRDDLYGSVRRPSSHACNRPRQPMPSTTMAEQPTKTGRAVYAWLVVYLIPLRGYLNAAA